MSDCNANLTPNEGLGVRLAGSVLDCYEDEQVSWTRATAPSRWLGAACGRSGEHCSAAAGALGQ